MKKQKKKIESAPEHARAAIYPLIGHARAVDFFKHTARRGGAHHAYLIVGPAQAGKERVAIECASILLQKEPARLREGIEYTLLERERDEKKNRQGAKITVEQIREMRAELAHSSFVSPVSIVIVRDAETMSEGAGNALLKTLEEPRKNVCIFLLAPHEDQLPVTIRSRCQTIRLAAVSRAQIAESLERHQSAGARADVALIAEAARLSNGMPGRALQLFNHPEGIDHYKEERDRIRALLDTTDVHAKFKAVSGFFGAKDHTAARARLIEALGEWEMIAQDMLHELTGLREQQTDASERDRFAHLTPARLGAFLEGIAQAEDALRRNIHPRLLIENLILHTI